MAKGENNVPLDPEVSAINAVVTALRDLDPPTQQNVIDYVVRRFKLRASSMEDAWTTPPPAPDAGPEPQEVLEEKPGTKGDQGDDGLEGISPVARKWMSRNGFKTTDLSKLFSLGIDEIDLVAPKVPGKGKKNRMRSVLLLKGMAAYLGTGAARVNHEPVKDACVHYQAYDMDNFAKYLKQMAAEVGGSKETGYTLTPRGITAATELIKQIVSPTTK